MLDWLDDDLNERRRRGLYRTRRRLQSAQGAHVVWQGRDFVNFSSNDYLALAADPRLAQAAANAARLYGSGAGASALVSGYSPPLRRLEKKLAEGEGSEAALVFSSGYAANLAVVSSLAGPDDLVFSDALNHASLIDGCRLSRAQVQVYRHNDLTQLAALLSGAMTARRRLLVSDSVFSMDGDFAFITDLLELAERFDALLVLDEAHATGVFGTQGRGLTELFNVAPSERLIKVGTLSKALGVQGGFVCGSRRLIRWLVNHARTYIFSTALSPLLAAAALRAVEIVQAEPERRVRLQELTEQMRAGLSQLGYPVSAEPCQILPLLVGDSRRAVRLSQALEKDGLLVPAIRPPSVPDGTARLRISLTAGHRTEDVERLLDALR